MIVPGTRIIGIASGVPQQCHRGWRGKGLEHIYGSYIVHKLVKFTWRIALLTQIDTKKKKR